MALTVSRPIRFTQTQPTAPPFEWNGSPTPARLIARVENDDVVIADPPRKGLDSELLAALCAHPAGRFVYLSCGLPAFLRECADLRRAGWRLAALEIWDFFPHTAHVETVARFEVVQ